MTTVKTKFELLAEGYRAIADAYHKLAGLVSKGDRHNTADWTTCTEQTCTQHVLYLSSIINMVDHQLKESDIPRDSLYP